MKTIFAILLSTLALMSVENVMAQDAAKGAAAQPQLSPVELEAKFVAAFTNATLTGRWFGSKDGKLGPSKEDSYTVVSVKKLQDDDWQINAQMKYGDQSFEIPIPAKVKWAGDTPVLILDHVSMGGPRSYSARVLVYENTYAGTWSGGDHGGLISGIITHAK